MIRQKLLGLPAERKAQIKSREIAQLNHRGMFSAGGLQIEVQELREVNGHVEAYIRAFDELGKPIGFGKDGSVEIERVRIINPPILVPDLSGEVSRRWIDPVTRLEREERYREDPIEAVQQVLVDAVRLIGKRNVRIKTGKVGRTTTVVYSASGDGNVLYAGSTSWSTTHGSAAGTGANATNTQGYLAATQYFAPSPQYRIDRGFLPFDTSAIPASDIIDTATLSVYSNNAPPADVNDANSFISVVQTKQASTTTLGTGDYDECGESSGSGWSNAAQTDIIEGATRRDIDTLGSGYNDFTLDGTGRGWVARSGETKPTGAASAGYTFLGLREGHDLLNQTYPSGTTRIDGFNDVFFSEETGTTKDPKLTVEHTPSATPVLIQKSLKYSVLTTPAAKTKSLKYAIQALVAITKSLKYTILATPTAIQKSLQYVISNTKIQKGLKYAVRADIVVQKSLKYAVLTEGVITKQLQYFLGSAIAITKSLQYVISPVPTSITKSLQYIVNTTPRPKKNVSIKAYTRAGDFLGEIQDASFRSFTKRIDEGLGECVFTVARKFDELGLDLVEGNRIEIFISDRETVVSTAGNNTGVRRIYSGRVSGVSLAVTGETEEVEVRCMGFWASLGLDVLKSAAQTKLYTRTTGGVGTTATPESVDIGAVVRGIMDRYDAETDDARITYTTESVPDVGQNMSYIFQQRTYREAIQKCLDAAPYGHHSFVDENNLFHFKPISTTPEHKFYFGKHFSEIRIERNINRTRNFLLLWAPNVGGGTYRDYSDGDSLLRYGRQVERVSDDNIQDTGTMDLVGDRFIAQNKDVEVRATATILDSNGEDGRGYDIESVQPGDTCAFYNFDSSVSSLLRENMIITEVEYTPDAIRITVEPVRFTVADITSRLRQLVSEEKALDVPSSYT